MGGWLLDLHTQPCYISRYPQTDRPAAQIRQQNELRDKWLSKIENTSCVLSEPGSELDGRYSIQVVVSLDDIRWIRRNLVVPD